MRKKNRLVYGVGVNDANYQVVNNHNGRSVACKFYRTWCDMLKRCYSIKTQERQPTYVGCSVHSEWLVFSNFKAWMEMQPWEGRQLDKDLIESGNKIYSKESCVFVTHMVNSFVTDARSNKGNLPTGVYDLLKKGKFRASCCNPFTGKRESLGVFLCPNEAGEAWRARKHELALMLSSMQDDPRVAYSLSTRYAPSKL